MYNIYIQRQTSFQIAWQKILCKLQKNFESITTKFITLLYLNVKID